MGTTKVEFHIQVAQARDGAAQTGGRGYYAEDRAQAFEHRKRAREVRQGDDEFEQLTDSSIDGAISTLDILSSADRVFSEERDIIRDTAETIINLR